MSNMRVAFVTLAVATSLTAGLVVASTATADESIKRCGTTVDSRPVVTTIHGLLGDPEVFDEKTSFRSMNKAIESVMGVKLVHAFDYRNYNTKWVTHEKLGPAFAEYLNCLSDASVEAGGDGRVIVIAHSMGGLVLREALNQKSAVHVKPEKIGLAIDIGTPHNGAPVAQWCDEIVCGWGADMEAVYAMRPRSRQLRRLPAMPQSVPLRAIAGEIRGSWIRTAGPGDGTVPTSSAQAQYTWNHVADGVFKVECNKAHWFDNRPPCYHDDLPKNTNVQTLVIQALGEYLLAIPEPTPSPTPTPWSPTPSPMPTPTCTWTTPPPVIPSPIPDPAPTEYPQPAPTCV